MEITPVRTDKRRLFARWFHPPPDHLRRGLRLPRLRQLANLAPLLVGAVGHRRMGPEHRAVARLVPVRLRRRMQLPQPLNIHTMKTLLATLAALVLGTARHNGQDARNHDRRYSQRQRTDSRNGHRRRAGTTCLQAKQEAKKGSVAVTLTASRPTQAEVSLFHDEDGDYQMKTGDRGPAGGLCRQEV